MRVDHQTSFLRFVYPFLFDADQFDMRAGQINQLRWNSDNSPSPIWNVEGFPRADLLPHVSQYLNPSDSMLAIGRLWTMDGNYLRSPRGFGGSAQWHLQVAAESQLQFFFDWIQLVLFRTGVGILTVQALPADDGFERWLDFLHFFRFCSTSRAKSVGARRRTGLDQSTGAPRFEAFFPFADDATQPPKRHVSGELINLMLQSVDREQQTWWRDVFVPGELLAYAAIFVRDAGSDDDVPQHLFRLRNFFHSRQGTNPAADDLRPDHPSQIPYADRQWFLFALEGGVFAAFDPPATQFYQETLPSHLQDQYFLLYLLALHQRFALMALSEQVARHWLVSARDQQAEVFARIRSRLLDFTAKALFTQIVQRGHHDRCYQKWLEVFQIERLYREVRDEVADMYGELQQRREERELRQNETRNVLLASLGLFLGVPGLIISFLGITLRDITSGEGIDAVRAAGCVLFGIPVAGVLLWLIRKCSRK